MSSAHPRRSAGRAARHVDLASLQRKVLRPQIAEMMKTARIALIGPISSYVAISNRPRGWALFRALLAGWAWRLFHPRWWW